MKDSEKPKDLVGELHKTFEEIFGERNKNWEASRTNPCSEIPINPFENEPKKGRCE